MPPAVVLRYGWTCGAVPSQVEVLNGSTQERYCKTAIRAERCMFIGNMFSQIVTFLGLEQTNSPEHDTLQVPRIAPARTSLVTKSIWSSNTKSYCLPALRPAFAPVFMLALAICSASHVCCSAHGVDSSASSSSGLSAR